MARATMFQPSVTPRSIRCTNCAVDRTSLSHFETTNAGRQSGSYLGQRRVPASILGWDSRPAEPESLNRLSQPTVPRIEVSVTPSR